MNIIRMSRLASSFTTRRASGPAILTHPHPTRLYAQQSYGGGEGDPKGENPQEQGKNPSEHLEHPGPPSPATGSGSKGSDSSQPGLSGDQDSEHRGPKKGASPKILDTAPPPEPSEDVEKHNREFEQRHDRAANKINPDGKQNVGKGFWSGQGGADRNP